MRIHLIAVGKRLPDWVNSGFEEYARRLGGRPSLKLIEITPGKRGNSIPVQKAIDEEWQRMQTAIPSGARLVALDEHGKQWRSQQLAKQLQNWMEISDDLVLLVGGADGLHAEALQRADQTWSLSELTLPHAVVRIVLAEQLYRAWSILNNHPYHRE